MKWAQFRKINIKLFLYSWIGEEEKAWIVWFFASLEKYFTFLVFLWEPAWCWDHAASIERWPFFHFFLLTWGITEIEKSSQEHYKMFWERSRLYRFYEAIFGCFKLSNWRVWPVWGTIEFYFRPHTFGLNRKLSITENYNKTK